MADNEADNENGDQCPDEQRGDLRCSAAAPADVETSPRILSLWPARDGFERRTSVVQAAVRQQPQGDSGSGGTSVCPTVVEFYRWCNILSPAPRTAGTVVGHTILLAHMSLYEDALHGSDKGRGGKGGWFARLLRLPPDAVAFRSGLSLLRGEAARKISAPTRPRHQGRTAPAGKDEEASGAPQQHA